MNVNVVKEFKIGSSVFFDMYDDYKSKDIDLLDLTDAPLFGKPMMNMKLKEKDIFFMPLESKDAMIDKTLESGVSMRVGKFLVPEFAEYIGLTIDDLKKLDSMFEELDEKHQYEVLIYNSYIDNNGFFLTDEQRDEAYRAYKEARNIKDNERPK